MSIKKGEFRPTGNLKLDFQSVSAPVCLWSVCQSEINLRKMSITFKVFEICWGTFANAFILTRSSPRGCKMTFEVGRSYDEVQILKKWNRPYLLNWVEYFDEILNTHWYGQNVAQCIVKCHLSLVEALPRSKFGHISWIFWNILIKFCIRVTIDTI